MSSSNGGGGKSNGQNQQQGGFTFEKSGGAGAGAPRKRRGPKQKGAGTIMKSKGEIKSGGVTIKEWQRTPKQLIQQYAQSNKRPRVQYRSARSSPGKFKILVVLPDGKNSEKDFRVTSNEEFKSKSEAEQASALLALFKLDGARQYEMKLPEPYRTAWLKLCGRDPGPAAAGPVADEFACEFCTKTFKKEHGLTIHRKREHADAIKQAAKEEAEAAALLTETQGGACATAAGATKPAVAAKPAKAAVAAPKPAAFAASWASADPSQLATAKATAAKEAKSAKDAPAMTLTSQMHFGTKHEQRLAREEKDRVRRAREAKSDARQRSNPLSQVFMSDSCRRQLEECVRRKYDSFPTNNASLESGVGTATGIPGSATTAAADTSLSDADQTVQEYVLAKVVSLGFRQSDAEYGLSQTAIPGCSEDTLTTRMLDWLCVHLPEDSLPKAFDPRGRQFEAVKHGVKKSASNTTSSANASGAHQRSANGKAVKTALGVLRAALGPHHQDGLDDMAAEGTDIDTCVLVKAYNRLLEQVGQPGGWPALPDSVGAAEISGWDDEDDDDDFDMFEDEYMALQSIFEPSEVTRQSSTSTATVDGVEMSLLKLTLNTGPLEGVPGATRVQFWISRKGTGGRNGSCYPIQVPLVVMVNPALDSEVLAGVSLDLFARAATDMRGSAMLYELWDMSRELLANAVKDNGNSATMVGMVRRAALTRLPLEEIEVEEEEQADTSRSKSFGRGGGRGGRGGGRSGGASRPRGPARLPSASEIDSQSKQLLQQHETQCQGKGRTGAAFVRMQGVRGRLPAGSYRAEVLRKIRENQVVLIAGATGCGKTTQIPQFVLEDFITKGEGGKANIVCTQPRRLAAVGVANRVADEQCVSVGGLVGYKIRFDNKTSRDTHLCYMTIGVLLRRLQSDPGLRGVTHVVVDEVHERSVESDFLLAILSELLKTRKNLKLILMSATMNEEVFIKYFGRLGSPCPIIRIPGFVHPVEEFYISDVRNLIADSNEQQYLDDDEEYEELNGGNSAFKNNKFKPKFGGLPQIDYALIAQLVIHINSHEDDNGSGAVLIFLPGTLEIKKCMNEIDSASRKSDMFGGRGAGNVPRIELVALHGALSGKDQARVFSRMPIGTRKVVCCTNVAETSVTVDDCVFVVDTGRMKEMQYDPLNGLAMLVEVWVAKANAKQRRGRAGRVRPGKCFKMFSHGKHQKMDENQMAEIHRTSLEHLVLEVLNLSMGSVHSFLGSLIEPPVRNQIDTAVRGLVAIGALGEEEVNNNNINSRNAPDPKLFLTPLGKHVAILPMEARLGKMLIFGSLLGCAGQMVTLAAGLSVRSPFMRPHEKSTEADEAKKKFAFGAAQSDHMCLIHAYDQWQACRGERSRRSFAEEHFLSHTTMNEMEKLRQEFVRALTDIGFSTSDSAGTAAAANAPNGSQTRLEMIQLVKAAICAGMYPNVANVWKPPQEFKDTMGGSVATAPEAKTIRFFAQHTDEAKGNIAIRPSYMWKHLYDLERLYMHPSSVNFDQREFANTLVVFRERVKTSRLFMRDCTVVSPYSILLFGGKVRVDHANGTVTVDDWISFKAPTKIGVLVQKLRVLLGRLLDSKITDPNMRIELEPEVKVMTLLLMKNGLG